MDWERREEQSSGLAGVPSPLLNSWLPNQLIALFVWPNTLLSFVGTEESAQEGKVGICNALTDIERCWNHCGCLQPFLSTCWAAFTCIHCLTHVLLQGPAVKQLQVTFALCWHAAEVYTYCFSSRICLSGANCWYPGVGQCSHLSRLKGERLSFSSSFTQQQVEKGLSFPLAFSVST